MLSEIKELVEAPRKKNITGARFDLKPTKGIKDTSVVDIENQMRTWVNELSKEDYATLKAEYSYRHGKHLRQEVDDPLDPQDTFDKLRGTLQRVKDTEEQLNTLHAEATKGDPPETPAKVVEDLTNLSSDQLLARWLKTGKGLLDDESGGITWPKWFNSASQSVAPTVAQAKKTVTDAMRNGWARYSDSLHKSFGDTDRKIMSIKDRQLILLKAVKADTALSDVEKDQVRVAAETLGGHNYLTGKAKEWWDNYVTPNKRLHANDYQYVYDQNKQYGYGWPLADPSRIGVNEYMPHILRKILRNRGEDDVNNPMIKVGRDYSPWNERLQPRIWKAAIDPTTGEQFVIKLEKNTKGDWVAERWEAQPDGTGKITGKVTKFDDNFDGEVGSAFAAPWGPNNTDILLQVDHGRVKDIKKATGGEVDFIDDPVLAFSVASEQMAITRAMLEQIRAIKDDPKWKDRTEGNRLWTDDHKEAEKLGWQPTRLKQFQYTRGAHPKELYYPPNIAWVLDDVYKKGWSTENSGFLEGFREVNTALAKIFNTYGPLIHPLNLMNQYTISRGFDWLKPKEYKNLAVHAANAFREVNSGVDGPLQRRFHAAGGNTLLRTVHHRTASEDLAAALGVDIQRDPKPWDIIAKMFGKTTSQVVDKLHDLAGDITWRSSDYLALMKFQDNIAKGMTDEQAVADVKKWIPDYQIATTVIGSGRKGRALQQFLMDPLTVAFGPWKYAVFKTYANMFKDAFKGTPAEQDQALGQWLAFMAMAFVAYPMLDKASQYITGNEKAKFSRRGAHGVAESGRRFTQGEAGPPISSVVTPSFGLTAGTEALINQTWGGKPIIPTLDWQRKPVDSALTAVGHGADWLGSTIFEPYDIISKEVKQNRGLGRGAVEGAKAIALDQVGIREPSRGAVKRQQQKNRYLSAEERSRARGNQGPISSALQGAKKGVIDWFDNEDE